MLPRSHLHPHAADRDAERNGGGQRNGARIHHGAVAGRAPRHASNVAARRQSDRTDIARHDGHADGPDGLHQDAWTGSRSPATGGICIDHDSRHGPDVGSMRRHGGDAAVDDRRGHAGRHVQPDRDGDLHGHGNQCADYPQHHDNADRALIK
jgi:hypothetical protein